MFDRLSKTLDRLSRKKPLPWYGVVAVDFIVFAVVLVTFALFHHVIPRKGQSMGSTMPNTMMQTAQPIQTTAASASPNEAFSTQSAVTPTVAPTTYPVGDFSATFPNYDTGNNALYSYQTDDLRIAITKEQGDHSVYFWADVWVRNIQTYRTAFANGQFGTGSILDWPVNIANSVNAVFAVTGDYCAARQSGLVIRNGELYRDSINSDICLLFADGTMETYTRNDADLQSNLQRGIWQGWAFGPELMHDGKAIEEFSSPIRGNNPRCAIGYYEPGHYSFVVVDGRQPGYSEGMTFTELSALFASKGCKAAFNLDGGQTAAMIFQGQVISSPSEGGRRSSDIICFSGGAQ